MSDSKQQNNYALTDCALDIRTRSEEHFHIVEANIYAKEEIVPRIISVNEVRMRWKSYTYNMMYKIALLQMVRLKLVKACYSFLEDRVSSWTSLQVAYFSDIIRLLRVVQCPPGICPVRDGIKLVTTKIGTIRSACGDFYRVAGHIDHSLKR